MRGQQHAEGAAPARLALHGDAGRPAAVMMPWQMDRPSPVPRPTGLVVKNGSKMRPRSSAGCPRRCRHRPITTRLRMHRRGDEDSGRPVRPSGMACAALIIRLRNTCASRPSFAEHQRHPGRSPSPAALYSALTGRCSAPSRAWCGRPPASAHRAGPGATQVSMPARCPGCASTRRCSRRRSVAPRRCLSAAVRAGEAGARGSAPACPTTGAGSRGWRGHRRWGC